jgi:hypothetical protein
MSTVLVNHACTSSYQDARYGVGVRVANLRRAKTATNEARCTVCGQTVSSSAWRQ